MSGNGGDGNRGYAPLAGARRYTFRIEDGSTPASETRISRRNGCRLLLPTSASSRHRCWGRKFAGADRRGSEPVASSSTRAWRGSANFNGDPLRERRPPPPSPSWSRPILRGRRSIAAHKRSAVAGKSRSELIHVRLAHQDGASLQQVFNYRGTAIPAHTEDRRGNRPSWDACRRRCCP